MKIKPFTNALAITTLLLLFFMVSCKENAKKPEEAAEITTENNSPAYKLSLAQWSLHKAINDDKTLHPLDFAQKAKEMGFEGIEYVSQLYRKTIDSLGMNVVLDSLKSKSETFGVKNVLIMVDGEGDLASQDDKIRTEAVENHKKWVDAAAFLGCHSIRVNLFGSNDPDIWVTNAVSGLQTLATYAKEKNVNIIVENHGQLSSNAELLSKVMDGVNMENCGTLPDFGNFCLKRENGEAWGAPCVEEYDKYKGVEQLMKYAKAVSAKSYDFDENGNETTIDYKRMMDIVKKAGYNGFVGVEYEGSRLSEEEGIKATRDLLIKLAE
ncbi:MAG: sugar phosphate isomerase/epimerase family protein [Flavobacteriaceae bacterium]|jgi:sugar phosphate isomerase/epimerase